MQFFSKIAIICGFLYSSICCSQDRFIISNEIRNGEFASPQIAVYDSVQQTKQELLPGFDSVAFSIQDITSEWSRVNDRTGCTDKEFSLSYGYIKYLFYLLRTTLNYEIILDYADASKKFGHPVCQLSFPELLKSCRPKTDEMKKFVARAKSYLMGQGNIGFYDFKQNARTLNLQSIINMNSSDIESPFAMALKKYCLSGSRCVEFNEEIKKHLQESCELRKEQFLSACSEDESQKDYLFSHEMLNLVKRSSAIDYIKKFGATNKCVDSFYSRYLNKTLDDDEMIRAVMRKAVRSSIPYLQGRLFVAGSLKEFDDLGVGNNIFQEIKSSKKELKLPKVKEVKKIIKKSPVMVKNIIKTINKEKPKKKIEKPKPRLSAVKKAYSELQSASSKEIAIDMDIFKQDFIFSNKALIKLHRPLATFQKRSSLEEMRHFDGLGDKKSPMRLLFLKYLIDNGYHQGLYNVQSVLGQKFYVKNDLESDDNKLYMMSIVNDQDTNNSWQIYLHKE